MKQASRTVISNQMTTYDKLGDLVNKHLNTEFKRPISRHNADAYKEAMNSIDTNKVIFDSGCGNGKSTLQLARQFPEAFVIGIDKSSHRLAKHQVLHNNDQDVTNYYIVRADLIDFWRLAANDDIKLFRHYILYPNPWPKKQHVGRRWHASSVFGHILQLGGKLEVRSNWKIYIQEFAQALSIAHFNCELKKVSLGNREPISDFEAKYLASGQALWQLQSSLNVDID